MALKYHILPDEIKNTIMGVLKFYDITDFLLRMYDLDIYVSRRIVQNKTKTYYGLRLPDFNGCKIYQSIEWNLFSGSITIIKDDVVIEIMNPGWIGF